MIPCEFVFVEFDDFVAKPHARVAWWPVVSCWGPGRTAWCGCCLGFSCQSTPCGRRVETSTDSGSTNLSSLTPDHAPVVVVSVVLWTFISAAMADAGAVGVVNPGDSRKLSGGISGLAGTSPAEKWFIGSRVGFSLNPRVHRNLTPQLSISQRGSASGSQSSLFLFLRTFLED